MSIEFMNRVWKQSNLKGSQRLLLLAIADNADDEGYAWPGVNYLAGKCNTTRQYIVKMIPELERAGELFVNRRKEDGDSNQYIILLGQCPQVIRDVLVKKMRVPEVHICPIVHKFLKGGVTYSIHGGVSPIGYTPCNPGVTPHVTQGLHEPSCNPQLPKHIPPPKNTCPPFEQPDYLTDCLNGKKSGVSEESASNPIDQFFGYRDEFLQFWQADGRGYPSEDIKGLIADLSARADADVGRWEQTLRECKLNWTGNSSHAPPARVFEVYEAGGTWQQWKENTYGKRPNGQQSKSSPAATRELQAKQAAIKAKIKARQGAN